jgi:hypothetical protein
VLQEIHALVGLYLAGVVKFHTFLGLTELRWFQYCPQALTNVWCFQYYPQALTHDWFFQYCPQAFTHVWWFQYCPQAITDLGLLGQIVKLIV